MSRPASSRWRFKRRRMHAWHTNARGERGDEVVGDPVDAEAGGHVEGEVADHEGEELEDGLRLRLRLLLLLLGVTGERVEAGGVSSFSPSHSCHPSCLPSCLHSFLQS